MTARTLAVADLHGHLSQFEEVLSLADASLGPDYVLVTLGDYVDNGPQIPELLDRLVALRQERGPRFVPIMGNHDLACARTLGWQGAAPDDAWWSQWRANFGGWTTCDAYRARSARDLAARMPAAHQEFLRELPWYFEADAHLFVHAGLEPGPARPQLDLLARKVLPAVPGFTNPQLRSRKLGAVSCPEWGKSVVSAHKLQPAPAGHPNSPHFADPWRIALSAESDKGPGRLWAVVLPERRLFVADPRGPAREAGLLA